MKKYLLLAMVIIYGAPLLHGQDIVNVKDINTAGSSAPFNLIISNDKLFFIAVDATNYRSLWVTLGTDATTTNLGPFGGSANSIQELQNYNNKIYFAYDDGVHGQEPWVSDGTIAGTKILKDINPGITRSYPQNFTVANNKLFFIANWTNGLYVTDGTEANTIVLKSNIVRSFQLEKAMAVLNNFVYFTSDDGTGSGYGLWKSDGTVAGTTLVQAGVNVAGLVHPYPILNNKMYLSVNNELWVTDGTDAGTHIVKDIYPSGNANPQNFIVYHNHIYFTAKDDTHGEELWVTDGTAIGTQMVKDVVPGSGSSQSRSITIYNDLLYFLALAPQQLWVTDGTTGNTQLVKDNFFSSTTFASVWNNTLYMFSEVYYSTDQSDGTTAGTIPMKADNTPFPISHYSQFFSDDYYLEYHGELYLQASVSGITTGYELCKLNAGALPLRLISFTGEIVGDNDILHWTTANEINTSSFIIEQSADGNAFKTAGRVEAAHNSPVNREYIFKQNSTLNPGGFYRLKMVDIDNTYTYSPVIKLVRENAKGFKIIYKSGDKSIFIKNQTNAICSWQLYSINGALINHGNSSNTSINIPLNNAVRGTCIIVCTAEGVTHSLKFIKM